MAATGVQEKEKYSSKSLSKRQQQQSERAETLRGKKKVQKENKQEGKSGKSGRGCDEKTRYTEVHQPLTLSPGLRQRH